MGQWNISIHGTGAHHNKGARFDANRIAAELVARLRAEGHTVTHATFTYGGEEVLHHEPLPKPVVADDYLAAQDAMASEVLGEDARDANDVRTAERVWSLAGQPVALGDCPGIDRPAFADLPPKVRARWVAAGRSARGLSVYPHTSVWSPKAVPDVKP